MSSSVVRMGVPPPPDNPMPPSSATENKVEAGIGVGGGKTLDALGAERKKLAAIS